MTQKEEVMNALREQVEADYLKANGIKMNRSLRREMEKRIEKRAEELMKMYH